MSPRVAVVPSALALLPEAVGRDDVLADLRERAVEVIGSVCRDLPPAVRVTLVVASDRVSVAASVATPDLSLGRRVGERLVGAAGVLPGRVDVVEVAWDAPTPECVALGASLARAAAQAVVVVADGSACRTEKAPGYLDERAFAVDDAIVAGLCRPEAQALLDLDPDICAAVLAAGRAPLQVLGGFLGEHAAYGREFENLVCHVEDPVGVLYVVAELALDGEEVRWLDRSLLGAPEQG